MRKFWLTSILVISGCRMAQADELKSGAAAAVSFSSVTSANFTANVSTFGSIGLDDGSLGAPSLYWFGAGRRTGFYRSGIGSINFGSVGASLFQISDTQFTMDTGKFLGADVGSRAAPGLYIGAATQGFASIANNRLMLVSNSKEAMMVRWADAVVTFGGMDPVGGVTISTMMTGAPILSVIDGTRNGRLLEVNLSSITTGVVVQTSSPVYINVLSTGSFNASPGRFSLVVTTNPITYGVAVTTTNHISVSGTTIALTACGTGPTATGTDTAFVITPGGSAGGCVATFGRPFINAPSCTVTARTGSLVNALSYTVTNVAVTITETSLSSLLDVHCIGLRE